MNQNIAIRVARLADTKQLMKLSKALYNVDLIEEFVLWKLKNSQEIVVVAEKGDELIGFACAQVKMSFCHDVLFGEVTELFVDESYRHQSIATSLIKVLESFFNNNRVEKIRVVMSSDNHGSIDIFENAGYMMLEQQIYEKKLEV